TSALNSCALMYLEIINSLAGELFLNRHIPVAVRVVWYRWLTRLSRDAAFVPTGVSVWRAQRVHRRVHRRVSLPGTRFHLLLFNCPIPLSSHGGRRGLAGSGCPAGLLVHSLEANRSGKWRPGPPKGWHRRWCRASQLEKVRVAVASRL